MATVDSTCEPVAGFDTCVSVERIGPSVASAFGFDTRVSVVYPESIVIWELRERIELASVEDSHVVLTEQLPYEVHDSISFAELYPSERLKSST